MADGSSAFGPNARPPRGLGRVVDAGAVFDLDHPPVGPALGEHPEHAREALVRRCRGVGVDRLADVVRKDVGKHLRELDERPDQLRVVLVAGLGEHARRKEERGRLVQRERERREERAALEAPLAVVLPERQLGVHLHGIEVAIHRPDRHADAVRHGLRADALRVPVQHHRDAQVASGLVPLGTAAVAVLDVHGAGAVDGSGPTLWGTVRSSAVMRAVMEPWRPALGHASPG